MTQKSKTEDNYYRVIAGMVTDILFRYDIETDRLMRRNCKNGIFGEEQYIENPANTLQQYIHPKDNEIFLRFMKSMKSGQPDMREEFRAMQASGGYCWYVLEGKTISTYGVPKYVVGRAKAIKDRPIDIDCIIDKNHTDMLTKVMKRSYINELLDLYYQSSPKEASALLVIDLDDFAAVNESMGHLFGDEVISSAARTLNSLLSKEDLIGRIGGDKFLICAKNTAGEEEAEKKARTIQKALKTIYVGENSKQVLSASIGIALYPDNATEYKKLYDLAVSALYEVKREGKNAYRFGKEGAMIKEAERVIMASNETYTTLDQGQAEHLDELGYEITELAFKLMEDEIDAESVIKLLLHKVADYYDLSAICIREITGKLNTTKVTYEYIRKDYEKSGLGEEIVMPEEVWNRYMYNYQNGYRVAYLEEAQSLNPNKSLTSYLRVPLYQKMKCIGTIELCDAMNKTDWSPAAIRTILMFARIVSNYLMNVRDYANAERLMDQISERDEVTGLYRYDVFLEKLQTEIDVRGICGILVVYTDISQFKQFNENFEYEMGDRLLKSLASSMIKEKLHPYLFGSRVYSDNLVAVYRVEPDSKMEDLLQEIRRFNQNFIAGIRSRFMRESISIHSGVYLLREGDNARIAVANANIARKEAREKNDHMPVAYYDGMSDEMVRQILMVAELPAAIENKELLVYMQPKVRSEDGVPIGAEALVRWKKKKGGFYFPDQFIPLFEKKGNIIEIDYYVYRETFAWLKGRLSRKEKVVPVSVNVSRLHLYDDSMLDYIDSLLKEYELPSSLIEFEITESIYISDLGRAVHLVEQLHKRGFKVAMDDFGSGYSSLNMLSNLPIDVLKLDKVFLDKNELAHGDRMILSCIVDMAKKLNIEVLCEGVENEKQSQFLKEIGCDLLQGYFYGRPMPIEAFEEYLNMYAE